MGRYKIVSTEVPVSKLDEWYSEVLEKYDKMDIISHTEVALKPNTMVRATIIFSDPFKSLYSDFDSRMKLMGCFFPEINDKDDDPDLDDSIEEGKLFS